MRLFLLDRKERFSVTGSAKQGANIWGGVFGFGILRHGGDNSSS